MNVNINWLSMKLGYSTVYISIKTDIGVHSITGLVSSGVILTLWGEGASLVLVDHPSNDGITIKILCG